MRTLNRIGPALRSSILAALLAVLLWLGLAASSRAADTTPLCRFGAGAFQTIANYPIGNMRFSWYADWTATLNPYRGSGLAYMPMVRFKMTGPDTYSASPTGQQLIDIARNNPGALWIVGNEPDRKLYQDDLEPQVYARAYHDLYYQIKAADPTARVAAGSIVQPTPLRLQYLDLFLNSYRAQFGEPLPVDVWNIHAFILREMSCEYDPNSCWGADVPRGVNAPYGMLYSIQDNDNFEVFKQFIVDFRQWMQSRGYQDKPLIITEFGILMFADYGFDAARVNAFMNKTFDYLLTAAGPTGYPSDGNRYVQQFAWYSVDDDNLNGPLFDRRTGQPTAYGQNYAAYTARVPSQVNFRATAASVQITRRGTGVEIRVVTRFVNNGNVRAAGPVKVRIYDGDPKAGGKQVAADAEVSNVYGCASSAAVVTSGTLPSTLPDRTAVWAVVDPDNQIAETNESDNAIRAVVMQPSDWIWIWLPSVINRH